MKIIPLTKAKAQLRRYGRICQKEPVVVTVNGVPSFQMVALDDDDDLIDNLIEHNPKFRALLRARLREKAIPAEEFLRKL